MAELAFGLGQTVLEKLASKAYEEIKLAKSAKDDLKKLGDMATMIKSVLNDAEKKQAQNDELRRWLDRLKDVLMDAADVLDEFECEALRRQVVRDFATAGRKVRRFISSSNPIVFRFSIAHRVKGVKETLAEITQDMAQFGLIRDQLGVHEQRIPVVDRERMGRTTHSFVKASEVIGRDTDKAEVIEMLMHQDERNDDGDNLSVIPIVGLGGLGKTTLAKLVFNDDKVKEKFDLKIWVCVSLEFNVHRLLREILKSATNAERDLSTLSLDQLQTLVRETLEGKKFLLVLDDVWNEDRDKWDELRPFLTVGGEGSKIVVTTRTTLVSRIMATTHPHQLKGLSEEDSTSLFFKCSFGDEKLTKSYPRLEDIGKEIVKKCGGVPLALRALGSLLYSRGEAKWISVRDSEIWKMEQEDDRILPALRLTYMILPSCMKQCFAYCSVFQEDANMWSFDLISIWMALGFLHSYEKMELEDVGQLQFQELCERCFFQCDQDDSDETFYDSFRTCTMHDLIHNLACSITKSECSIVKSGLENISNNIRYLRLFWSKNNLKCVQGLEKLWSLHIGEGEYGSTIDEFSLSTFIKQFKYLRVFDLSFLSFEVLPSSLGALKHLRYLNLSGNKRIKKLPSSLYKLQSLQTLLLGGCTMLEELPRDVRKLVSLRTLGVTTNQTSFPENGIGCLKSLQTLFIVYCKNLSALPHDMIHCTSMRTLFIEHCVELDLSSKDDECVTNLSLQKILFRDLPETKALPQWLNRASQTLKILHIEHCNKLVELPMHFPDFSSLEHLVIKECKSISTLPDGIFCLPSLTQLNIEDCEQLQLATGDGDVVQLKLQKFKIESVPLITALPWGLQGASRTLQVLEICNCPKLASLPEWLVDFVSLQKLQIWDCDEVSDLPEGMQHLTSLTDIDIGQCAELELVSKSSEVVTLSLHSFSISRLPQTTNLPQWLQGASHTLQDLWIVGCENLASLPEWLPDLTSLKNLWIIKCPKLSTLPAGMSRLTSLTHLEIRECSTEFEERYKREVGEDWHNIAHVPHVGIGFDN